MSNLSWTSTRHALPERGQPVQFILDGRQFPLSGTYSHAGFHSRWSCYAERRVRLWRSIAAGVPPLPPSSPGPKPPMRRPHSAGIHPA